VENNCQKCALRNRPPVATFQTFSCNFQCFFFFF